jgi:hypothetical protein
LKGSRACSGTGLRDWSGSSDTVEGTLLNDISKTFYYLRGSEITGGGSLLFAPPYRFDRGWVGFESRINIQI